jgi:alkanesulfonate monooxygenase SsuD/methylene tetrahydromethanopterin reductase-like flavin-dependent oxidoreductase (luciferase family)
MKFGIMTQIQIPRPWTDTSEREGYWHALDQGVAAEQAGFEHFWITEQHFLAEIGHAPASDMFLAALSQRTTTMRLGLGVVVLPIHNPFNVAERVACLDVLSNGRVEFGTGRGTTPYILEGLGFDPKDARGRGQESIEAIMQMYDDPRFQGYKGEHFDLPAREVIPRPIQTPHPPLWVAATNLETYEHAGRQGFGVIGATRASVEDTKAAIAKYRSAIENTTEDQMVGRVTNNQTAVFGIGCCHEDDEKGKEIACAGARWYYGDNDAELNHMRFATAPGGVDQIRKNISKLSNDEMIENGMALGGNPDTICRIVDKWASTGIDQMIFFMRAGFTKHEDVMNSIRLIGEKVIPKFQ